ncbi:MAG: class I SAM-dependent methyltransferase [Gammaproteobacteria bacterium]|nr:class I SAM-dependent methyltransferase [Gammaproteobacteria bacterium]
MSDAEESNIIQSWHRNAQAWISAIQNNEINSRIDLTNQAIVDAVLQHKPKSVLDIGCGEGWLSRAINKEGIDTLGIDVVPELIEYATQQNLGRFKLLAYDDLTYANIKQKFDLAVANFSLLGKESVDQIIENLPELLNSHGHVIIQTLHPLTVGVNSPDKDAWQEGSWDGFNEQFINPAAWYCRSIESWKSLLLANQFTLVSHTSTLDTTTQQPVSLIIMGQLAS